MASTSSVHKKSYLYDVFLSFSGEDTRRTFIDHLYVALDHQGIRTFKDDKRLEKGKRINDQLLQSIEDSRLYVIVFSKKYASSSWCLNELLKIIECQKNGQQIAYPVFYDVEPTEVRKQIGSVGEALSVHKNELEVGIWREALKEAANLSGWDLRKIADGHEAQMIRLIVEEISRELCSYNHVNIDEKSVGIQQRIQDLELSLKIGLDDVRMIGIKGMGGAGKTTLARAIFGKLSTQFEDRTFVENVREVSKASLSGLNSLQKQVLTDVLKDQFISVSSVHDGINMMKMRLSGKKVLVVLDDVDHISQLEALAGDNSWFKPGSRIIITTRDEQVLLSHRGVSLIHNVDLLLDEEATRLFSRYAFGKNIPPKEYEKESFEVVRYAAGLPLTLKVLGSLLCGKGKPEWIDTLARLKTIPLEETVKNLEVSYDSLEDEQKEIFLDVACLLKSWRIEEAIRMLEGCGYHARNGLRVLQRKSLITIEVVSQYGIHYVMDDESVRERYERICMHDHIEEMGKSIVRRLHPHDPCRHSRLWVQDEIKDVLARDIGSEETRCIRMELTPDIDLTGLLNMKKLRCLIVNIGNIITDPDYVWDGHKFCKYLPNALQCLFWGNYPHSCLPKISGANNLVTLELYNSKIERLWEGETDLKKLKYLLLYSCENFKSLPKSFCSIQSLKVLRLHCCDIEEFPEDFDQLEYLEELFFDFATRYKPLPDSICKLKHVKTLSLCCRFLEKLPEDLGKLESLEVLDLSSCKSIRDIPSSICKLRYLKKLNLNNCNALEKLPGNLGKLESLEVLDLSSCESIREIPGSICKLKHLKKLNLINCNVLETLPGDIGKLDYLEVLDLSSCNSIREIPGSVCELKHLKILNLNNCNALEWLPGDVGKLESMEVLDLSSCNSIREIPGSVCELKLLKNLNLNNCNALIRLPGDVGKLESLEVLDLSSCKSIRDIPGSICKLKHLKKLNLNDCIVLETLPGDFGKLESLEVLDLSSCNSIREIPGSVCELKHLKILNLNNCNALEWLPGDVGKLESMEVLDLSSCNSIREIPASICELKLLKTLNLNNCNALIRLPGDVGKLESLEVLDLSSCKSIRDIPGSICKLKHLKKLNLNDCIVLETLPGDFGKLESLEVLDLSSCNSIREIPGSVCELKHLKILNLNNCNALEWLPGDVGKLEFMEVLDLSSCNSIREIPDSVCELKLLKNLNLNNCNALIRLPGDVGKLESLEVLDLSSCKSIKDIPGSICKLRNLKKLNLNNCNALENIPGNLGKLESLEVLNLSSCESIREIPGSICKLKHLKKLIILYPSCNTREI